MRDGSPSSAAQPPPTASPLPGREGDPPGRRRQGEGAPAAPLAAPAEADRQRERGYRLANAVSYLLNPLVLPPVSFALIQAHFGADGAAIAWTFGVSLVFFCVVPLLYVAGMVRAGRIASYDVPDRERRFGLFLVSVGSYALGTVLLWRTLEGPALPLVVAFAALFPLNTAVLLLINTRWKISVHMTSLAGFVGVLLFTALTVWRDLPADVELALTLATVGPLVVLVPLLMWARVRVGAHTVGQVVAGALFGLVVPQVQLWWIVHVWLGLVG